jgi:hypothetical protein
MDPAIRGALEQEIEKLTSSLYLDVIIHEMEKSFPTTNLKDLIFGVIVGYLWGTWRTIMRQKNKGLPTEQETVQEFWEMMRKRTIEIKGKINLALNK